MQDLDSLPRREAAFMQPMECLAVPHLPNGVDWAYEIKLDGYRAIAINSNGKLSLLSKNQKSFNRQHPYLVEALNDLPENTVVDGEVVALDDAGQPAFQPASAFSRPSIKNLLFRLRPARLPESRSDATTVHRPPSDHEFCVEVRVKSYPYDSTL
jgi:bifunctional non-homologous end joining protein LigD